MKHFALVVFVVLASVVQAERPPEPPPISVAEAEGVSREADFEGESIAALVTYSGEWYFDPCPELTRPPLMMWGKSVNATWTRDISDLDLIAEIHALSFRPRERFLGAEIGSWLRRYGVSLNREKWSCRMTVIIWKAVYDHPDDSEPRPGRFVAGPFMGIGQAKGNSYEVYADSYGWSEGFNLAFGELAPSECEQFAAMERAIRNLHLMEESR